jgi:sporulation protein YlmC with PRC-barrel domain
MSELDLGLGVLDHQLVDSEGRNCGNVDDLELDLDDPAGARVVAVLSGPEAWRTRGRIARATAALFSGGGLVRVPWNEVESIDSSVRLRSRADELGLGRGDAVLGPLIERLPGGRL